MGNTNLKACTACKLVKYCNRECQIAHRPHHKKECRKRAAELHDEKLFKQPPPEEECPICFLQMPGISLVQMYMACCGKVICGGCVHASDMLNIDEQLCPFCRTPVPTSEREMIERYEKRMESNDAIAMYNIGGFYSEGKYGYPQNTAKALELWHLAAELGHSVAYNNIGNAYEIGRGVEIDKKKAVHYFELAAMSGNVYARNYLGYEEIIAGNINRALNHWMIAVEGGFKESLTLENIKEFCKTGHATKDDYATALRKYQAYLDEIKSQQRDEAAAADDRYKYY